MSITRQYTTFAGGQNRFKGNTANTVILDQGGTEAMAFCHSSKNWQNTESGLLQSAGDEALITSPTSAVVTGDKKWKGKRILCKGTKIYTVSGGTETEIWPLLGTPQTAGKFYQFTEWADSDGNDILLMMNGEDKVLEYDGTTVSQITVNDPDGIWDDFRPQGAMVFRGNIFYWGDPDRPHRFIKPKPGTHNDCDNTEKSVEAQDVDAGFGGILTGMRALTDDLAIVYKEICIRRMSGMNPFGSTVDPISIRPISDEVGCIAPRSIVQDGSFNQYYLSQGGLRKLQPTQSFGDVSADQPTYPIQDVMNDLNYSDSVIVNACAVFDKQTNLVWLSVPYGSSSTNSLVLTYNTVTGCCDLRGDGDITASTLTIVDQQVHTGDYSGQLYKHGDAYSYHGEAIDSEWESKWINHNGSAYRKLYRWAYVHAESDGAGELITQVLVLDEDEQRDETDTETLSTGENAWDTAIWDSSVFGNGQERVIRIKISEKGHAIKFRFINNANNQNVKIRQVDLVYDLIRG